MMPSQDVVDSLWGLGGFIATIIIFAIIGITLAFVAKKWGK
ncbi:MULTISPECIES: hypothetical protein [unclassified Arthrobacter]|nr:MULTISPECIES: hypothetical protein [unclassified Arthrobacter]